MRNMLSLPWWERILAGDSTAIPANWLGEDNKLTLAGEEAVEFLQILASNDVELDEELARACDDYVVRSVINKTGKHPYHTPDWEKLYE